MKTLIFFRKPYLLLFMVSIVLFVSCNDDQEDVIQETATASLITDVDIFASSTNYTSYLETGFDIDLNDYEKVETDDGTLLLFNVSNSKTRGQNNAAEFIVVVLDNDRKIERTFMLGYKNTPNKEYTGDIQFGLIDNNSEIVSLNFEKGKIAPLEQQPDLLSRMEEEIVDGAGCGIIGLPVCVVITHANLSLIEGFICGLAEPACFAIIAAECSRLGCPSGGVEFPL